MQDDLRFVETMLTVCNVAALAKRTGVSDITLYKMSKGELANPTYEVVKTLADFFRNPYEADREQG